MKNGFYLGIDIGGTKCAVVAGDEDFNIYKKIQFETRTGELSIQNIFKTNSN